MYHSVNVKGLTEEFKVENHPKPIMILERDCAADNSVVSDAQGDSISCMRRLPEKYDWEIESRINKFSSKLTEISSASESEISVMVSKQNKSSYENHISSPVIRFNTPLNLNSKNAYQENFIHPQNGRVLDKSNYEENKKDSFENISANYKQSSSLYDQEKIAHSSKHASEEKVYETSKQPCNPTNSLSPFSFSEKYQEEMSSPCQYFFMCCLKELQEKIEILQGKVNSLEKLPDKVNSLEKQMESFKIQFHSSNEKNSCPPESTRFPADPNWQDSCYFKAGFDYANHQREENVKSGLEKTQTQKTSISTMTSLIFQQKTFQTDISASKKDASIQCSEGSNTQVDIKVKNKTPTQSNSKRDKKLLKEKKKTEKSNKSNKNLPEQENLVPLNLSVRRNLSTPKQQEIEKKMSYTPKEDNIETPKSSKSNEPKCCSKHRNSCERNSSHERNAQAENYANRLEGMHRHDVKYLGKENIEKEGNLAENHKKVKSYSRKSIHSEEHKKEHSKDGKVRKARKSRHKTHDRHKCRHSRDSSVSSTSTFESPQASPQCSDKSELTMVSSESVFHRSSSFHNYGVNSQELTVGTKGYLDKYKLGDLYRKPISPAHKHLYQ